MFGSSAQAVLGGNSTDVVTDNPGLVPLGDNGGPTRTHALFAGSPAIDAGAPGVAAGGNDQRGVGFDRVLDGDGLGGARIDIGAFEAAAIEILDPTSLVVSTDVDEFDGNFSEGDLSLREAIFLSNSVSTPTTITFSSLFDTARTCLLYTSPSPRDRG